MNRSKYESLDILPFPTADTIGAGNLYLGCLTQLTFVDNFWWIAEFRQPTQSIRIWVPCGAWLLKSDLVGLLYAEAKGEVALFMRSGLVPTFAVPGSELRKSDEPRRYLGAAPAQLNVGSPSRN
jgi:hypothetical protein